MKITNLLAPLSDKDLLFLYISILFCIVIGSIFVVLQLSRKGINKKKELYANILTNIPDPVISYETVIPTNLVDPKPTHHRRVGLYSLVEPNKIQHGHYNESKIDLLVTNGLFTIGSNWLYDLVFVA